MEEQKMDRLRTILERALSPLAWMGERWKLITLLTFLLVSLTAEGPSPGDIEARIDYMLTGYRFDFVGWETRAMWSKLAHGLVAPQRYMDEQTRHDFFLDYLRLVGEIQQLEWELRRVYTDPEVADPAAATADQRRRLATLRALENARQPTAEAIMEEQVATVLADYGFGTLGQEMPPIEAQFTPLPLLLVVSPRERIERIFSRSLTHGLNVAEQERIEMQIDETVDVSSLITGIGGLAAYPSMLLESASLNWVMEVTAHEWAHHYLTPRPLGWNYDAAAETRTINETVASIVGKEVGRAVVARYYPELLPPEPSPPTEPPDAEEPPPAFDFRAEMRETRIRVDELLAEGEIEEAEAYMEQQRQLFVAEGYGIRKLNQAYFAFHGAYADEPGAAGADPIGPQVRALRQRAPDLHTFVAQVAGITTLAELEALLESFEADTARTP
jgi:hypothetical protein